MNKIVKLIKTLLETDIIKNYLEFNNYDDLVEQVAVYFMANKLPDKDTIFNNLKQIINLFSDYCASDFYDSECVEEIYSGVYEVKTFYFESQLSYLKHFPSNDNEKREALLLHLLLILFVSFKYFELNLEVTHNLDKLVSNLEQRIGAVQNQHIFWYRGVTNFDYDLIPSMYRDLSSGEHHIIDNNKILSFYERNKLLTEYKNIFDSDFNINNDFLTYMQHSIAYSPLIDFSKEINIAGSLLYFIKI